MGYNNGGHGEVAQLVRAFGSYPKCQEFESLLRYQNKNHGRLNGVRGFLVYHNARKTPRF